MRTRTRLTTPPGQGPALADEGRPDDETYVPGLAIPEEPRVPGPRRRLWITLAVMAVVAVAASVTFLVVTAGQTFDPALEPEVGGEATGSATPEDDLASDG